MKERVLRIGRPTPLVGVATEPETFDPARPALLILNSGIMHHVGTCRMSVHLARRVSAAGVLAVRFDYSGVGDSEPRKGTPPFHEVSVTECAEVMDYLQKTRGVTKFILYGLCSGADAAYNTALADPRVIAISQFDPYCYETPRFYVQYYLPLLADVDRWKSFLGRRWASFKGRPAPRRPSGPDIDAEYLELPTYVRTFPPREAVATGLRTLVQRSVRVQANFPSGPQYNHRSQFRRSFRDVDFGDLIEVNFYKLANHIVTQPPQQEIVLRDIAAWVERVVDVRRQS